MNNRDGELPKLFRLCVIFLSLRLLVFIVNTPRSIWITHAYRIQFLSPIRNYIAELERYNMAAHTLAELVRGHYFILHVRAQQQQQQQRDCIERFYLRGYGYAKKVTSNKKLKAT